MEAAAAAAILLRRLVDDNLPYIVESHGTEVAFYWSCPGRINADFE